MIFASLCGCYYYKAKYNNANHNIIALNDSIAYYTNRLGNEVATRLIYETDLKGLKQLNKDLYEEINALKLKKPETVIKYVTETTLPQNDTIFLVEDNRLDNDFEFSDEWRSLNGNVKLIDNNLNLSIYKETINSDFIVSLDKDNRIHITSSCPYIKVNNIEGFTLPKQKQKHFHVGPMIGIGLGSEFKVEPFIGVGLTYSIFSF